MVAHPRQPIPEPTHQVIIAVMGPTGAGKSYFINRVSGIKEVKIGDSLNSCTSKLDQWSFNHHNQNITLLDTPGFNDTTRTDTEILKEIATYLQLTYSHGIYLSGIIYLHSIAENRMGGSAIKTLRMFKKLCGREAMKKVIFATTMWDENDAIAQAHRESELRDNFWETPLREGATLKRFDGTKESGLGLVEMLMEGGTVKTEIQRQLVDEGKVLKETSAGNILDEELKKALGSLTEQIEALKLELKGAKVDKKEIMDELEEVRQKLNKTEEQHDDLNRHFYDYRGKFGLGRQESCRIL